MHLQDHTKLEARIGATHTALEERIQDSVTTLSRQNRDRLVDCWALFCSISYIRQSQHDTPQQLCPVDRHYRLGACSCEKLELQNQQCTVDIRGLSETTNKQHTTLQQTIIQSVSAQDKRVQQLRSHVEERADRLEQQSEWYMKYAKTLAVRKISMSIH
eukprot:SAG31_NODE_3200_length_4562_cov_7.550955_2_plen_159_part_00